MARSRLPMRKLREILEHVLERGRSIRRGSVQSGVSRRSARRTLDRFRSSGLEWPDGRSLDEGSLGSVLYPAPSGDRGSRSMSTIHVARPIPGRVGDSVAPSGGGRCAADGVHIGIR